MKYLYVFDEEIRVGKPAEENIAVSGVGISLQHNALRVSFGTAGPAAAINAYGITAADLDALAAWATRAASWFRESTRERARIAAEEKALAEAPTTGVAS